MVMLVAVVMMVMVVVQKYNSRRGRRRGILAQECCLCVSMTPLTLTYDGKSAVVPFVTCTR